MTTIAMLHRLKNPEKVEKAYGCAAAARLEGVNFYYFTPGMVDLDRKVIYGKEYTHGQWQQRTFPYPDVIYNSKKPVSKKQQHIFNELKKEIPFISTPIGSKLKVYQKIKAGKDFAGFLIPYQTYQNIEQFFNFLHLHKEIVLKPSNGNKGKSVHFIKKKNNSFTLDQSLISEQELRAFIREKTSQKKTWIIQKYINSKTKQGLPYDIRLLVLKGSEGKWDQIIIYPRTSLTDGAVSNISAGGQTSLIDEFLRNEFGSNSFDIKRTLEVFTLQFATHFENLYQGKQFDQLGIDIGIDEKEKIWIYEVNWRPGSTFFNLQVCRSIVQYSKFVADRKTAQKRR